ncbi:hypothetical protein SAY87_006286 [Trapa incisa]|uniref:Bifunctional lysine-specific demethylase and histidyl-hydroxylase n=1 Tax=Trapa incisa TaxID=236973 RepID=A0AAN7JZ75_9MYRT|nr:hypothetical protein SAY87_006286 [Trapa incisa]
MEEEYLVILLDAIIVLVNSCCKEQLEDIPIQSLDSFLVILKTAWMHLSSRMLVKVLDSNKTGKYFSANSRVKDLAECIFRLSINDKCANLVPSEDIRRRIFRSHDGSLENFLISHWETTPLLVDSLRAANGDDCFRPFLHYLNWDGALPHSMTCMLQNMFSCPPIASDELDILNYLKQEKDKFALPILYQQDIRVLKMDRKLNTEKHFFPEGPDSCSQIPYILSCNDIVKCEEALEKGFTLAIRGMEFRFKSVAAITEELASLFGLPSVGANLYLTPPNSQGLARHYDDHCVFVCQLVGSKQWKISPPQSKLLPRLYEQISGACLSPTSDGKNSCMQITLKEGDLLYIPRGFIHEAYTNDGEFSLHLTLAIEVEAPFEWEGFMHAALSCWSLKNIKRVIIEDPLSENLDFMSIKLLHVTIGLLGDSDKIFRKACLVGSLSWSSHLSDWLEQNQRTTFSQLVEKIDKSKFTEVLKALDMVVQQNDDLFQRLAWIRVFYPEEGTFGGLNERKFDVTAEDILALCYKDREKSETAFTDLKSRFCKEIEFQQGISGYSLVLEKYKKVRKQYLNGMLSMHCKFK